jgi:hypothetical protein
VVVVVVVVGVRAPTVESQGVPNWLSKPLYILDVLLLRLDKVNVEDSRPSWKCILCR